MGFNFKKRIYGYECDIYGHLNNAHYLPILEAARSEALQEMGIPIQKLLDLHWSIYVLRFEIDYIKSLQLEDMIEVKSTILSMNKVKGIWRQEIFNSKDELCFNALMTAVFAYQGKPARLPAEIYDIFTEYLEQSPEPI